jgi:hypothetical protein
VIGLAEMAGMESMVASRRAVLDGCWPPWSPGTPPEDRAQLGRHPPPLRGIATRRLTQMFRPVTFQPARKPSRRVPRRRHVSGARHALHQGIQRLGERRAGHQTAGTRPGSTAPPVEESRLDLSGPPRRRVGWTTSRTPSTWTALESARCGSPPVSAIKWSALLSLSAINALPNRSAATGPERGLRIVTVLHKQRRDRHDPARAAHAGPDHVGP